jgi:CheY-like chemotaxis protein/sRNA-binding carbon storage regulator CsrA
VLVVSRRPDEEIVFPNLGIRIKVLRNDGSRTRLGIEAPTTVQVLRGELVGARTSGGDAGTLSHEFRNTLNAVKLAITMFERQTAAGDIDGGHQTFLRMLERLRRAEGSVPTPSLTHSNDSSGTRVLVVEDDANERELLAGLLRMEGCDVLTAPDGLDALDGLSKGADPEVVLLDMQMPRMGGCETLRAIRSHSDWRNLTVFGVSGAPAESYGVTVGGSDGVDAWFQKPLNPCRLVQLMQQQRTGRELATSA